VSVWGSFRAFARLFVIEIRCCNTPFYSVTLARLFPYKSVLNNPPALPFRYERLDLMWNNHQRYSHSSSPFKNLSHLRCPQSFQVRACHHLNGIFSPRHSQQNHEWHGQHPQYPQQVPCSAHSSIDASWVRQNGSLHPTCSLRLFRILDLPVYPIHCREGYISSFGYLLQSLSRSVTSPYSSNYTLLEVICQACPVLSVLTEVFHVVRVSAPSKVTSSIIE